MRTLSYFAAAAVFFTALGSDVSAVKSKEETPLPGMERGKSRGNEKAMKALGGSQSTSVHKLMKRAFTMAHEWSPGAALYSILGRAPRNKRMWEPEEWGFVFGDPETRDGMFEIIYRDQMIYSRKGVKDKVLMVEYFEKGKFLKREAGLVEWSNLDYDTCRPVAPKFLDTPELEKRIRENKIAAGQMEQYRISMFNAIDNHCDGLGHLSRFIIEKPLPKKLRNKTLWMVSGLKETVYFDAVTGNILLRRELKSAQATTGSEEESEDFKKE